MLRLRLRPLLHWALFGALLWAALAPGLSRAMAALQGDAQPWSVVCSAAGGGNNGVLPDGDLAHAGPHCLNCLLQCNAAALPPAALAELQLLHLSLTVPMQLLRAPRLLPVWAAAQARAPPQAT